MMEQYIEIKAANPDCLLFYRMGDFYELFFDDAEVASRALGIVLTKRGKHLGRDIPMCGVPIERADEYLHRLIALGHRVAVCEQLEDPGRGAKARRQERRAPRRGAAGDAGHADRGFAARRPAQQLSAGAGARARLLRRRTASRWPGSISRPASSASPNATARALAAEIARLEPGEIIVSDALYADPELAPLSALAAGGDAADARRVRRRDRRAPARGVLRRRDDGGLRRVLAARAHGGGGRRSPMSSARSSASARRCRRRCARRPARRSRSIRRRAAISNSSARSPASGAARCSPPSTAP